MSVTTRRAFALEGVGGQADRPEEIRLLGQVLADGGVLLVEREMAGDQGQDAAGLQGVERLGDEEIVQRQLLAAVVELDVGKRQVADHGVDAALGQLGVAEILDADVGSGCRARAMRPEMRSSSTPMNRMPSGAMAHEIAGAAARLQHGGVAGHAEAGERLVHGRDDGGRGVEGVEGGAFGRVVFLGREQRFQLLAEGLPAGVLVAAGDRVGEERQGHGPEAAEAGEVCRSSAVAGRCSCSTACSVRMAAMMSRALAFSPLAMTGGAAWSCRFLP